MIYRGECEELYGREMPDPPAHDCLDHLRTRSSDHVERHGFDCGPYERWHEEWEECRVCDAKFEPSEVAQMWAERWAAECALEPTE